MLCNFAVSKSSSNYRGYGGTRTLFSPEQEHQPRATTATRRGSPPCLPAIPKLQTRHRNTGRHGGLPLQLGATTAQMLRVCPLQQKGKPIYGKGKILTTCRGRLPCLPACPQAADKPPKHGQTRESAPTAGSHDAPYRWKRGSRLPKKRCYAGLRHCFLEKKDRFFNQ